MPKRGNHRWSQGHEPDLIEPGPSEFERVTVRLNLSPDQYASSPQLHAWVEKNWRQKFVPENLLKVWGLKDWGPPED